jgi:D-alanyl-lipoteichoic acid acyltransferase DltB (MBOAT superfamily)
MLFNSYAYILAFLPLTATLYLWLNRLGLARQATLLLILASLYFYASWRLDFLPLLLGSIVFNYLLGRRLSDHAHRRRGLLALGILANILLLGVFKYTDFLIDTLNRLANSQLTPLGLTLPLAISFFTFQQIAYLVDSYRGATREYDFTRYALFVTFFPQLIAGPIVHHSEMMPQFANRENRRINHQNIAQGITIFCIGLFKKVMIADYFAGIATPGFDQHEALSFFEAWATSLSYSLQLYFDFSGYTDMAIGSALLFNIRLPVNFDSPYKARNIQDFWRRWHITLSRFLRDYIYIPLGGNRGSSLATGRNLMLTFVIGGLWHGAGWTFVFWGFLHGVAMIAQRVWGWLRVDLPHWLAWLITFNFVNASWVFFRARHWDDALRVLRGMTDLSGLRLSEHLARYPLIDRLAEQHPQWFAHLHLGRTPYFLIALMLYIAFTRPNSQQLIARFKPTPRLAALVSLTLMALLLNMGKVSEFLYFNF